MAPKVWEDFEKCVLDGGGINSREQDKGLFRRPYVWHSKELPVQENQAEVWVIANR